MPPSLVDAASAVLEEKIGSYSTSVLLPPGDLILVVEPIGSFSYSRRVVLVTRTYQVPDLPPVHGQEVGVGPGATLIRGDMGYPSLMTFRAVRFSGRFEFKYSVYEGGNLVIVNPSSLALGVASTEVSTFVPTATAPVEAFPSDPLRVGGLLFNDGNKAATIGFNSPAQASGAILLQPGGVIDLPPGYSGVINAAFNVATSQVAAQKLRLLSYKAP